jgi:hypothetical protein
MRKLCRRGFFLLLALTAGCATGPRTYKVAGTVSCDGEPVAEGDLLLFPLDKSTGPVAARIRDGRFECRAREGDHRVEISMSKIIPGSKVRGAGGEPVAEEYLPERYNAKSTLTLEVAAGDDNHCDFPLESGRKRQGSGPR